MDTYEQNGYRNRQEYLMCLSEEYGVDYSKVQFIAEMLGRSEDFDGLVSTLQDMEYYY